MLLEDSQMLLLGDSQMLLGDTPMPVDKLKRVDKRLVLGGTLVPLGDSLGLLAGIEQRQGREGILEADRKLEVVPLCQSGKQDQTLELNGKRIYLKLIVSLSKAMTHSTHSTSKIQRGNIESGKNKRKNICHVDQTTFNKDFAIRASSE